MRTNTVKQMLRAGEATIGTWLTLPDPLVAQMMARVGFDWLNVEMEHSTTTLETAALMFQGIAQAECVPLARVGWATGENVKRVLDSGAWGVIFPQQMTREEVEQAVMWSKYPPVGCRGMGGSLAALSFDTDSTEYFRRANDETLVVVQIEHIEAVERADELLSVPGVDAVFIGPTDLGASMGLPRGTDADHPKLAAAIDRVREAAQRHGVAPGIHVFSPEAARKRLAEGFRFLALMSDTRFMLGAAKEALAAVRG